jgi:hypothetical protein
LTIYWHSFAFKPRASRADISVKGGRRGAAVAENGDIKIEVTRPDELGKIARLIATTRDVESAPPKLRRLVELVGTDARPEDLGALAETDTRFAELLREVLRESVTINGDNNTVVQRSLFTRIKNDWSRKKKTTFVFLFVLISVGGASLFTLAPDRGEADLPEEDKGAVVAQSSPTSLPGAPPGSSSPVVPPAAAPPSAPPNNRPGGNPTQPGPTNPGPTQPQSPPVQLQTTASQTRGLPGTSVNFYGTGFSSCPGRRTVNVLWDGVVTGEAVPIEPDGRFGTRFTVPENASVGQHQLDGRCTDDTGLWSRTTYTVSPPLVVTATPAKLKAGQVLSVRGTNFDGCPDYGDRTVNVSIDALGLTTRAPINADGTVDAQFTIPPGTASNDYYVTGQCRDGGQWARGIFTVQP